MCLFVPFLLKIKQSKKVKWVSLIVLWFICLMIVQRFSQVDIKIQVIYNILKLENCLIWESSCSTTGLMLFWFQTSCFFKVFFTARQLCNVDNAESLCSEKTVTWKNCCWSSCLSQTARNWLICMQTYSRVCHQQFLKTIYQLLNRLTGTH